MKLAYLIPLSILLSACVPQSEYDEVVATNIILMQRIDDLENGEARLIATIEQTFKLGKYDEAERAFTKLKTKHPQSETIPKYTQLIATIETRKQALRKRNKAMRAHAEKKRIADKKEKDRLANLNNTGIWKATHYVDDFGEPTKKGYIQNLSKIRGRFSNSATQDSKLNVDIMVDSSTEVDLMLYEYAGNNPVKAYSPDKYSVQLQDKNGNRYKLIATNYGNRLSFGPKHSRTIWNALLRGGKVSFRIYEIDTPTTQYAFEVTNADHFDNAVRLMGK